MSTEQDLRDLVQRVVGADDVPPRSGDREPIEIERAPPAGERLTREPDPDRFAADPWEQRAAALERRLAEKNRRILTLEVEIGQRDRRLKDAFLLLREAEEAAEIGAKLAQFPGEEAELPGPARAAAPDTLARLASEKGILEAQERRLRVEVEKLRRECANLARGVRARDVSLAESREVIESRNKQLRELREKQLNSEKVAEEGVRVANQRLIQLRDEKLRALEQLRALDQPRRHLEEALLNSEKQAALYRTNLLKTEEAHRLREQELRESAAAIAELRRKVEQLAGELDDRNRETSANESRLERLEAQGVSAREALEGKLRQSQEKQQTAADDFEVACAERDAMRAENERLSKLLAAHEARLTEVESGDESRSLPTDADSLRMELLASRRAITDLRTELTRERAMRNEAETTNTCLEERLLASFRLGDRALLLAARERAGTARREDEASREPSGFRRLFRKRG